MRNIQKTALPLEKNDTCRKMCHSHKNVSQFKKCVSQLEEFVTFRKMFQIEKGVKVRKFVRKREMSQLEKWVMSQ